MLKSETKTIGDMSVTTTQFPASKAFPLLARVLKTLAPMMGALDGTSMKAEVSDAMPAIAAALAGIDPADLSSLMQDLLISTWVIPAGGEARIELAGGAAKIDQAFNGKMRALLETALFAIEVNFRDFFPVSAPRATPTPTPSA